MFYVLLGLTIVALFIVLVIAFSYVDKHNNKNEWEDWTKSSKTKEDEKREKINALLRIKVWRKDSLYHSLE